MNQTNQTADIAAVEVLDAELQSAPGAVPHGVYSNALGVIALEDFAEGEIPSLVNQQGRGKLEAVPVNSVEQGRFNSMSVCRHLFHLIEVRYRIAGACSAWPQVLISDGF